jgi:hypothetical protein
MRPRRLTQVVFFSLSLVFLHRTHAFLAEIPKPSRTFDLKGELCPEESQQYNIPLAGIDFVSENQVLAYTVCRAESIAFSRRNKFQKTDPYHLRAVIINTATARVEQHFDWPTHGKGSGVRVTHQGDLLLHRDNFLELLSTDGRSLASLEIAKPGSEDTFVSVSPTVDIVAVSQGVLVKTRSAASATIFNSRNLHLLQNWQDNGDVWGLSASTKTAVRSAMHQELLAMKTLASGEWKTVDTGNLPVTGVPVFINDSQFAVPARDAVLLFNTAGLLEAKLPCNTAMKAIVSRNATTLGAIWVKSASHNPDPGRPKLTDAGIDIYRLPFTSRVTSIPINPPPGFGFDVAVSPNGSKLAIVDHLTVSLFEIPDR